jgi:hypothetical protein
MPDKKLRTREDLERVVRALATTQFPPRVVGGPEGT